MNTSAEQTILVTAAVIERGGLVLIARRAQSDHGAGGWEFPGGKVEADETPEACLARELREELGITVVVGALVSDHVYQYPARAIRLLAFRAVIDEGEPAALYHEELAWVAPRALRNYALLPADLPVVAALLREDQTP